MPDNNPMQYVDPIIQSMVATVQNNRAIEASKNAAQKTAEEIRSNKAQEQQRKDDQKRLEDQFNKTHDLAIQAADVANKHTQAMIEASRLANVLSLGKGVQEGYIKPTGGMQPGQIPTVLNQGQAPGFNIPGMGNVHASQFESPDQKSARDLAQKAAEYKSQREAQEGMLQFQNNLGVSPTKQAELQNTKDVANINVAGRLNNTETKDDADYKKAIAIALLHSTGQGQSLDPDTADQYVQGLFVNGKIKLNQIPLKQRGGVLAAGKALGYNAPLDSKDNELIDGIPMMQQFFQKARKLAELDTGISGTLGTATGGLVGDKEAGRIKGELDGMLGNIARIYGGEKGVLTQRDIERGTGLVHSIKQGKEANLKTVTDLENTFNSKIGPVLKNYTPAQQKAILEGRDITLSAPDATSSSGGYKKTAIGPNKHRIGTNDNGGTWYDIQTGKQVQLQ